MKRVQMRTGALGAASAAAMAVAGALTTPVAAQGMGDEAALAIEEIVVTAQRREQRIQDVPMAISTLSGEEFETIFLAGEDIRALSARVPALNAESSNGRVAPRFYIRGLGNTDFDLAASQPVLVVIDEVVMENVILKSSPIFDMQGVEVLKGPQGTLFGRNTPAGIVKFETRKPTEELDAYASLTYGNRNTVNAEGAVGGALIPGVLKARVSGLIQRRDDYIDKVVVDEKNAVGGFRDMAGRIQLDFTPTDRFSALAKFHVRDLDSTAALFRANVIAPGGGVVDRFDRETIFHDSEVNNPQKYNSWGASLRLGYDFDAFTVTTISAFETTDGFSRGDIDGGFTGPNSFFNPANPPQPPFTPDTIAFPSETQDGIDDLDQYTQEIRFASPGDDRFNWQFGAFFFNSDLKITTDRFFVDPSTVLHENTAWALFGHADYKITPRLTVTAGLRYTDDDKDFEVLSSPFFGPTPRNVQDDKLSWDFAVNYALTDQITLYARHARGFRAPTIQGRDVAFDGAPSIAQSETIKSFEGGFKSVLFDNRLSVNAAGYWYEINGQQLTAVGGGDNLIRLVNADRGVGYGFEADARVQILEGLSATAAFAWTKTELQDETLAVPPCGSGLCQVVDPLDPNGNALVDGNPFPQAPEYTLYLTARYERPVGEAGLVFVSTDWYVQGETNFFLYNAPEFRTNGNFEGGARAGYSYDGGRYEVSLFARNITDKVNIQGAIDFTALTGYLNEPRTFGVNLTARY
ncbi:iron complex outermembrane receptor protein [Rhodothalassium salexigens DSM 2132]|uniref:Iron complex outermembrane receptor protein n=1 Tax=Rhodothalassium salexigens DSM 2132 TaxID=1188247 RepID=A0A4R2P7J6_RHOSA|nr:TonB-dependent receptor [Rhodothalassium salexigens]MBB4212733.1 iron complex outermembrane receptor protein [Rhodothalassium salexigens DSM 2132]TCP30164.1 iron complex outermembrane receptor protein [Rhodothalassium salexigens DSM 2132]